MAGKKSEFGLIIKLLIALAAGALLGRVAGVPVMDAVVSVKYALGQIIFFVVPLVIIGFIAPAIIRLGRNASKMLFVAVALAYRSRRSPATSSSPIFPSPRRFKIWSPCPSPPLSSIFLRS